MKALKSCLSVLFIIQVHIWNSVYKIFSIYSHKLYNSLKCPVRQENRCIALSLSLKVNKDNDVPSEGRAGCPWCCGSLTKTAGASLPQARIHLLAPRPQVPVGPNTTARSCCCCHCYCGQSETGGGGSGGKADGVPSNLLQPPHPHQVLEGPLLKPVCEVKSCHVSGHN